MYQFFKDYFIFSHQKQGYSVPKVNGLTKVSKKERIVAIIISYIVLLMSSLIFLTPLRWYNNLFLWITIVSIPIYFIFNFDYRILKIIRLFRYSRSQNINKRMIYESYMMDDYRNIFLEIFKDYNRKRINIDNTSFRYRMDCSLKNIHLSVIIKPKTIIIKINNYREIIKDNKNDYRTLLMAISEKIKSNFLSWTSSIKAD